VLEVRPAGRQLLSRLVPGEEVALAAPRPAELRFLRHLAGLGLVELRPAGSTWPSLTIVVPVRDRPAELAACLRSLDEVRYGGRRPGVVVVDDGSTSPISVPLGVRLVRLPRSQGPAGARNAGAAICRTELIGFIDCDCTADPGWLQALVPELADPEVAAVGGRVLPMSGRGWLERYEAVRSPLDLGSKRAGARPQDAVPYLVTANMVIRRSALQAVGGLDSRLRCGEDVDLSWRLCAAGHRLTYQPAAVVHHRHRGAPVDFVRTRVSYATSEAALLARHPGNGRWLGLSPGIAALLVGALGGLLGRRSLVAAGALVAGAELAATATKLETLGVSRSISTPALLRGQANGLYFLARQLSRYYGLPAALVALGARRHRVAAGLAVAAASLVPATVDWWRLHPSMPLPGFVAASMLDDVAYQLGLWLGCLRQRSLAALGVELRVRSR
jgi:mycofactocin system glycosyltransferase